jgi:hypothetical protein
MDFGVTPDDSEPTGGNGKIMDGKIIGRDSGTGMMLSPARHGVAGRRE